MGEKRPKKVEGYVIKSHFFSVSDTNDIFYQQAWPFCTAWSVRSLSISSTVDTWWSTKIWQHESTWPMRNFPFKKKEGSITRPGCHLKRYKRKYPTEIGKPPICGATPSCCGNWRRGKYLSPIKVRWKSEWGLRWRVWGYRSNQVYRHTWRNW